MVVAIHSQKNKGRGWEAVQSVKSTHCASTRTRGQSPAPQRSCVWLCVTPAVMARGSQSRCGKVLWISVASQLSWKGKSLASGSLNPFVKESRVVIEQNTWHFLTCTCTHKIVLRKSSLLLGYFSSWAGPVSRFLCCFYCCQWIGLFL